MIFVGEPKIVSEPMLPVRRHWICPTCQNGEMVFTGEELTTPMPDAAKFSHSCNNPGCRVSWYAKKKYPCIEFVPIPKPVPGE